MKRATVCIVAAMNVICYFNPRPREEGDNVEDLTLPGIKISIHALVKRATLTKGRTFAGVDISIHALVKRATSISELSYNRIVISIHALVKRATTLKTVYM